MNADGKRAQPFWSSKERVLTIIENVPAYKGFEVFEINWEDFTTRWIPGLAKDEILVGVNWSGERATGYDIKLDEMFANVMARMSRSQ